MVECNGKSVLLDSGIKLGKARNELPEIPLEVPARLSAVIASHAHFDHIGFIPALVKHGFKGSIFCTKPTRDLMHLLLADALGIAKEKKQELYSVNDVEKTMKLVRVLPFEKQDRIHPHGYLKVQINERPEYIAMNASKRIWYASDSIWIN